MALSILWKLATRKLTIDTNLGQQVPNVTKAGGLLSDNATFGTYYGGVRYPTSFSSAPLYVRLLTLAIVSWLFDYVGIRFNSYN